MSYKVTMQGSFTSNRLC